MKNRIALALLDADLQAFRTRYEAARLTMWQAWIRVEEVRNPEGGTPFFNLDRYSSSTLNEEAVGAALSHAAKDPDCAIWVHLDTGTLTAWPAFESPRNWSWAMLEDFRDTASVPPRWHTMSYPDRFAELLTAWPEIQEDWEATLYEMRADEVMRTEWTDRRNQQYLLDTKENPRE